MGAQELREMILLLRGYVFGVHLVDWLIVGFGVSVIVFLAAKTNFKRTNN